MESTKVICNWQTELWHSIHKCRTEEFVLFTICIGRYITIYQSLIT